MADNINDSTNTFGPTGDDPAPLSTPTQGAFYTPEAEARLAVDGGNSASPTAGWRVPLAALGDLTTSPVELDRYPGIPVGVLSLTHTIMAKNAPLVRLSPIGSRAFDPEIVALFLTADARAGRMPDGARVLSVQGLEVEEVANLVARVDDLRDLLRSPRVIDNVVDSLFPNASAPLRANTTYGFVANVRRAIFMALPGDTSDSLRLTVAEVWASALAGTGFFAETVGQFSYVERRRRRFATGRDLQVDVVRHAIAGLLRETDVRIILPHGAITTRVLAGAMLELGQRVALALDGVRQQLEEHKRILNLLRLRLTQNDTLARELISDAVLNSTAMSTLARNMVIVDAALDPVNDSTPGEMAADIGKHRHTLAEGLKHLLALIEASPRLADVTLAEAVSPLRVTQCTTSTGTLFATIVSADMDLAPKPVLGRTIDGVELGVSKFEPMTHATSNAQLLGAGVISRRASSQLHERLRVALEQIPAPDASDPDCRSSLIVMNVPAADRDAFLRALATHRAAATRLVRVPPELGGQGEAAPDNLLVDAAGYRLEWTMTAVAERLLGGETLPDRVVITGSPETAMIGVPSAVPTAMLDFSRAYAPLDELKNYTFGAETAEPITDEDSYELLMASPDGTPVRAALELRNILGIETRRPLAYLANDGLQDACTAALANALLVPAVIAGWAEAGGLPRERQREAWRLAAGTLMAALMRDLTVHSQTSHVRGLVDRAVYQLVHRAKPEARAQLIDLLGRDAVRASVSARMIMMIASYCGVVRHGSRLQEAFTAEASSTGAPALLHQLRVLTEQGGLN